MKKATQRKMWRENSWGHGKECLEQLSKPGSSQTVEAKEVYFEK